MPYIVDRPGGTKNAEFEAYVRLLRQRGVNLAEVQRVLDPTTGKNWLYVWDFDEQAQEFASELRKRTRDNEWQVVEVNAPASRGPLGPALFLVSRQADGFSFEVHPLTMAMVRAAFPKAAPSATTVFVTADNLENFRKTHGGMEELVREIGPTLTGLDNREFESLGFRVVDVDTDAAVVDVPPAVEG